MKEQYFFIFLTSFFAGLILTRIAYSTAQYIDFTAKPGDHKIHERPVSYLGGVAVYLAMVLGIAGIVSGDQFLPFVILSFLVMLLGLADDALDLSGVLKITIILIIGLVTAVLVDRIKFFPHALLGDASYYLNLMVTSLWILLLISAMNAIDNMDGLAAGLCIISCISIFIISAYQFPQPDLAVLSIALGGACLGFLPFNFHPGVIFLGDAGSFLVGYSLATLAFIGSWSAHPLKAFTIPTIILSVPVLDLMFTILYRMFLGETSGLREAIEYSAQDHLSHRIQQSGNFGQRRTVLIVYGLATITGLIGVIIRNTNPFEAVMALVTAIIVYMMVILIILPDHRRIVERMNQNHAGE